MNYIGIDLGGTNIAVGITDENHKLLYKSSLPTGASRPADEITADMARLCRTVAEGAGVPFSSVAGIGIASPGAVLCDTGVVMYSCNLPFDKYPIAARLREYCGVENIRLENDANAAALGEAVAGAAKGSASSVMITLGTGVGGGIITDGKIFTGFNGAAGEIGHTVIEHGGAECPCGRRGCFEAYCSASALIRMTREALAEYRAIGEKTEIEALCGGDEAKINGKTAFDAMRAGDAAGGAVVDKFISYLACGIINLVNTFQPEVIVIGGGVSHEGNFLLDPLVPIVEREQYTRSYDVKCKIRIAALGNDAGIIGAAAAAIK